MLFRMVSILLMFYIVFIMCNAESSKNKGDGLLRTTTSKNGITIGNIFHVNDSKKRTKNFKPSWCKLPHEIGPCRDAKERYYYDPTTNECKFFTYGGCRGNRNNFPSLKKCQKTCKM